MVKIENDCVECDLPCLGDACLLRNSKHYYCDDCGDEAEIYDYNGEELCVDCLLKRFKKISC